MMLRYYDRSWGKLGFLQVACGARCVSAKEGQSGWRRTPRPALLHLHFTPVSDIGGENDDCMCETKLHL